MKEERIWLLLSLKISGEATEEELQELRSALLRDPDMEMKAELLGNIWTKGDCGEANTESFFRRHIQRLDQHINSSGSVKSIALTDHPANDKKVVAITKYKKFWWASAVAACILILSIIIYRYDKQLDQKRDLVAENQVVCVPRGSKSFVALPDGTKVWLNADSKVIFNRNSFKKRRELVLEGEAFFDVMKDSANPFVIHAKAVNITVLGTAFNVRAYPDEGFMETSLYRGSVEVALMDKPNEKVILKPNEKLSIEDFTDPVLGNKADSKANAGAGDMKISEVQFQKEESDSLSLENLWMENKLVFDAESMEEVARKIERWYDVEVVIQNDDLKQTKFSGIFDNESVDQVIDALHITGKFKYKIIQNTIILW